VVIVRAAVDDEVTVAVVVETWAAATRLPGDTTVEDVGLPLA